MCSVSTVFYENTNVCYQSEYHSHSAGSFQALALSQCVSLFSQNYCSTTVPGPYKLRQMTGHRKSGGVSLLGVFSWGVVTLVVTGKRDWF